MRPVLKRKSVYEGLMLQISLEIQKFFYVL